MMGAADHARDPRNLFFHLLHCRLSLPVRAMHSAHAQRGPYAEDALSRGPEGDFLIKNILDFIQGW